MQPSQIIQAWLDDPTFKHIGLEQLRLGNCGEAFHLLDMGFEVGAPFNRVFKTGRGLHKLMGELEKKGY